MKARRYRPIKCDCSNPNCRFWVVLENVGPREVRMAFGLDQQKAEAVASVLNLIDNGNAPPKRMN